MLAGWDCLYNSTGFDSCSCVVLKRVYSKLPVVLYSRTVAAAHCKHSSTSISFTDFPIVWLVRGTGTVLLKKASTELSFSILKF